MSLINQIIDRHEEAEVILDRLMSTLEEDYTKTQVKIEDIGRIVDITSELNSYGIMVDLDTTSKNEYWELLETVSTTGLEAEGIGQKLIMAAQTVLMAVLGAIIGWLVGTLLNKVFGGAPGSKGGGVDYSSKSEHMVTLPLEKNKLLYRLSEMHGMGVGTMVNIHMSGSNSDLGDKDAFVKEFGEFLAFLKGLDKRQVITLYNKIGDVPASLIDSVSILTNQNLLDNLVYIERGLKKNRTLHNKVSGVDIRDHYRAIYSEYKTELNTDPKTPKDTEFYYLGSLEKSYREILKGIKGYLRSLEGLKKDLDNTKVPDITFSADEKEIELWYNKTYLPMMVQLPSDFFKFMLQYRYVPEERITSSVYSQIKGVTDELDTTMSQRNKKELQKLLGGDTNDHTDIINDIDGMGPMGFSEVYKNRTKLITYIKGSVKDAEVKYKALKLLKAT